jgi:DNA-binding HxlR family transcriptional regulator
MADDTSPFPYQKLASEGSLERRQRQRILEVLEEHPDGIGFNELLSEVDDIISRNTLKKRLDEYEGEELVQSPDDWRRGQKKKYSLTEKGTEPDGLNDEFENGLKYIWHRWEKALEMYDEDDFSRKEVQNYILNERVRFCLTTSVSANNTKEDYSPEIEIEANQLPEPRKDVSDAEFYNMIGAELYKFYTETIFGRIYIKTEGKASRLKKDIMLRTYESTKVLRERMNEMREESNVPFPESDSSAIQEE